MAEQESFLRPSPPPSTISSAVRPPSSSVRAGSTAPLPVGKYQPPRYENRAVYQPVKAKNAMSAAVRQQYHDDAEAYFSKKIYAKLNKAAFGSGRQPYAWAALAWTLSALLFCGSVVVISVQKFHRWTPQLDRLEFFGPALLAGSVALLGIGYHQYYRAYKRSCVDRQHLRIKSTDTGTSAVTGIYLVNPRTDESDARGDADQLTTGQVTDQAVPKVDPAVYAEAMQPTVPYGGMYLPPQVGPIDSLNWQQSHLSAGMASLSAAPYQNVPGQPFLGIPPAPPPGSMVDGSPSGTPPQPQQPSSAKPSKKGTTSSVSSAATSKSGGDKFFDAETASGAGKKSSVETSTIKSSPTSSPRFAKRSVGPGSAGSGAIGASSRPKPKITGMGLGSLPSKQTTTPGSTYIGVSSGSSTAARGSSSGKAAPIIQDMDDD